ncbi:thioesterase II family protein [Melittangium boletus]|uniref:thioesterase II family protein n=1 Tax=Melittangium boletus TaxID=83453 RepID=UPI000BB2FE6B|nr:alpha/beta fold hydrolase [Melittangium boletus]
MKSSVQTQAAPSPWLVRRKPSAEPRIRLFCFPHAGSGSLPYFKWPELLPRDIDVCAVQLPGRENRRQEPALTDLQQLTAKLVEVLTPYLEEDFAFFGHSFGAILSFELIRELRRRGLPLPQVLFASGAKAPSRHGTLPRWSALSREEFVRELSARPGAVPPQILAEPDLIDLILPTLRADLKVMEDYVYREEPPLPVRLCVLGGTEDTEVPAATLEPWREETREAFTLRMFPGGHLFITEVTEQVLQAIRHELTLVPPQPPTP